jgi:hypothetical protein
MDWSIHGGATHLSLAPSVPKPAHLAFFLIKDYKSGLYIHKWTYTINDYNGALKLQTS